MAHLVRGQKVIHASLKLTGTLKKIEILDTGEIYYHIEPLPNQGFSGKRADILIEDPEGMEPTKATEPT